MVMMWISGPKIPATMPSMKGMRTIPLLGFVALAFLAYAAAVPSAAPQNAGGKMSPEELAMHQAAKAQTEVEQQGKGGSRVYEPTLTYLTPNDEEPHVDAEQVRKFNS